MERTRHQRVYPRRDADRHANFIALCIGFLHVVSGFMQFDCQEVFERKIVIFKMVKEKFIRPELGISWLKLIILKIKIGNIE